MRLLHLAYSDALGGASRASYRIHRALLGVGAESRMLVRRKVTDDPTVEGDGSLAQKLRERLDVRLSARRQSPATDRSLNLVPSRWAATVRSRDVDVVNLHWHGRGAMSIGDVARVSQPLVMTLHDMWALTASAHYAPDDPSAWWRQGGEDPSAHLHGLEKLAWRAKKRHAPAVVVCPSRWLAECVSDSRLMGDWPVLVIPYPLPLDVLRPRDPAVARDLLGLPQDRAIVLFGADGGAADARKGADLLLDALPRLLSGRDVMVVGFGASRAPTGWADAPPIRWLGRLGDEITLSLAYSAADVMVVPSRQDNLPQTAIEAQACGTPVVAFDVGGLADAVDHEQTGVLVAPFDTAALADSVGKLLDTPERRSRFGAAARRRAEELWSPERVAKAHLEAGHDAVELRRARR